jgi:L-threonylcarbamoyladenylate synthase
LLKNTVSLITNQIDAVIKSLRQGDIVAIPTETVYGLAGNAENAQAVTKIFAMKQRPLSHPLIMHVSEHCDLNQWVEKVPDYALKLIDAFWPGPLTLVFQSKPGKVNPLVTGGQTTVAIRCPKHPLTQTLLDELTFPLVAPSANPFGKISPTTAEHVRHSFKDQDLLILDGGRCPIGIESTIVLATDPDSYQILRHGMIDEQALSQVLNRSAWAGDSGIRVPGKLASHYQPEKPLYCFAELKEMQTFCQAQKDAYVLSRHKDTHFKEFSGYQLPANPEQLAYELYFQLRQADQSSSPVIVIELPPNDIGWEGINERILKASMKV